MSDLLYIGKEWKYYMKKIRIISTFTIIILLFIILVSCSNEHISLKEYSDVYVSISDDTQKEIEEAYKAKYGKDLKWSAPKDDVSSFDSIASLKDYIESNYGLRLYGKHQDSYILCEYDSPKITTEYVNLKYNEIELLNDRSIFSLQYFNTYIYSDGNFEQISNAEYDLAKYIDISLEEALEIKENHEKYMDKYFKKFMIESDQDLIETYYRIFTDVKNKDYYS